MPHLISQNPTYRKHDASGQAIVTLNGYDIYLGPHGTRASRLKYDQVIAEWLANGRQYRPPGTGDLTVVEVIARYLPFVDSYYRGPRMERRPPSPPRSRACCGRCENSTGTHWRRRSDRCASRPCNRK